MDAFEQQRGMTAYTQWWIAHPWHVTGTLESGQVPADCNCGCQGATKLTTSKKMDSQQRRGGGLT
jgi:hypothetical protein